MRKLVNRMKVAICDDCIEDIRQLNEQINRYICETSATIHVDTYWQKEKILTALENSNAYDLLFLDIYMNTLNGIDLARHIRKQGGTSKIVFVSSSEDHALEAFGVNATQYLVKPVEYESVFNAINLVQEEKKHRNYVLNLSFGGELIKVPFINILYIETQRNYQYLHLTDGNAHRVRLTAAEMFNYLQEKEEFVRVGSSYIINLEYVIRITSKDIELINHKMITIPRGAATTLKNQYLKYYSM